MEQNPHRPPGDLAESTMFVAPMAQGRLVNVEDGTTFLVSGNITTIGRGEANKITIMDRSISRTHCRIELTASGYRVVDLDSTNGTFVNDHRVTRTTLHAGDVLRLGAVALRFEE